MEASAGQHQPEDGDLDPDCAVTRFVKPSIQLSRDLVELGLSAGARAPRAVLHHAGRLPLLGSTEGPPDAGGGEAMRAD